VPITGSRQVLTDALIARLARIGSRTRQALGGADQDIEWAVVGDEVLILQSRPYVEGSARASPAGTGLLRTPRVAYGSW